MPTEISNGESGLSVRTKLNSLFNNVEVLQEDRIATAELKLATIETNADVTDTANVTVAGALMDSELADEAGVKAYKKPYYATVAAIASAVSGGMTWDDNTIISTPKVQFIASSGAAVTGLPAGLIPYGKIYPDHWLDNTIPGTTDMTAAVNSWFNYGDELHVMPNSYRVSTGVITRANGDYVVRGAGSYVSDFVTSDLTGDVFTLTMTGSAIFNVHWSGFRIRCDGGTRTSGAFVRAEGPIRNCSFRNITVRNMYDGFRFSGAETSRFEDIRADQFGIGSGKGRYVFNFESYAPDNAHPTGIYASDIELSGLNGSGGSGLAAHFSFNAIDGFYLSNAHMFYADNCLRFSPAASADRDFCASVQVSNVYFDTSFGTHVLYQGTTLTAGKYTQHRYSNCTFRDAQGANGSITIAASTPLDTLQIVNSRIASNTGSGIYTNSPCLATNLMVSNTFFKGNNAGNLASAGDISWRGAGGVISGTIHETGGAAGHTIGLLSGSSDTRVSNYMDTNSTATGIVDSGTDNWVNVLRSQSRVASYATRAALVSAWSDGLLDDGAIVSDGTVQYKAVSGSTAIADLPGLVPYGKAYPDHWATNTTPGTTDMTTAFTRAVAYTKELYLFDTIYLVTDEIRIYGRYGFKMTGVNKTTTEIRVPTGSFDVLTFYTGETSGSTNIGCNGIELRDFKIQQLDATERTGGYFINFEQRGLYCVFENLIINNAHGGIRALAMAYTHITKCNFEGSRRTTPGGYALCFTSDEFAGAYNPNNPDETAKCTDVHVTDCQFNAQNSASLGYIPNPYAAAVNIESADGIYFVNCHIRGATNSVRIVSDLDVARSTVSSIDFTQCYFDGVEGSHVIWLGYGNGYSYTSSGGSSTVAVKFRDHKFNNCRFRFAKSANGSCVAFLTSGTVDRVSWIGGTIRDNVASGIRAAADEVGFQYAKIDNVTFSGNNTDNSAAHGDVYIHNADHMITDNTLIGGGDLGYGIRTITSASGGPSVIRGNDVRNSTAANPITPGDSIVYGNPGYIQTNSGTATVLSGTTSIAVTHGLNVTPAVDDIQLTILDATVSGVTRVGVQSGSITSTQFTIETNAAPAANFRVIWAVDAQKRQE